MFISDFYLDDADLDTCIWVVPGSHEWSDARTAEAIAERNRDGLPQRTPRRPPRSGDQAPKSVDCSPICLIK